MQLNERYQELIKFLRVHGFIQPSSDLFEKRFENGICKIDLGEIFSVGVNFTSGDIHHLTFKGKHEQLNELSQMLTKHRIIEPVCG